MTSGNHTTFDAGTAGVFDVTTTGTPGVSSVTDSAFSGCIPRPSRPASRLNYTGGTSATLDGTPQAGDDGTFTVCLTAANGVGPVATQVFTLTVDAPAAPPAPAPTPPSPVSRRRHSTATGWSVRTAASSPSAPPSSTARPVHCICSAPSSASRRRRTAAGTGWSPRTAASSPSAMPATSDPFRGAASTQPDPACPTA